MNDLLAQAAAQFTRCCITQPRYRVAWLTGLPYSGKSVLARQLRDAMQWQYLDYTMTAGYFDALGSSITSYQPEQLTAALQDWCRACDADVLIVDELDALLATWDFQQQLAWTSQVSRLAYLPTGLVLVTHFFDQTALLRYLPDNDPLYCFEYSGDAR